MRAYMYVYVCACVHVRARFYMSYVCVSYYLCAHGVLSMFVYGCMWCVGVCGGVCW